jgi:ketosteroid isomerase-like protein
VPVLHGTDHTSPRGAALSLRNTATAPDGRRLDEHLATVLTTQCGRITAIDSYLSDVYVSHHMCLINCLWTVGRSPA